jgi:hypothetical protein
LPNNWLSKLYNKFTYKKDGLYTLHNTNFTKDSDFNKAYLAGKSTGSWGEYDIEWRAHVALWYAKYAFQFDGDFVECGVNKGGLSRAIVEYLDFSKTNKKFFLFDTFEGFDTSLLSDTEKEKYLKSTHYEPSYEHVKTVFQNFPFIKIVKGPVPRTLTDVQIDKVAYLSIDMNCVLPEEQALDFFWPKLVKGAVIVLDDFAYEGFEEQNINHTKWAKSKGIEILSLPTGQGIIIK